MNDPFNTLRARGGPIRLACLGEPMLELSDLEAADSRVALGVAGDSLNCAVYVRRMCPSEAAEIEYLTALGADALSDRMVTFMQAQGLGTGSIARFPQKLPGLYAIEVDESGERSFRYWRSESAARSMFDSGGIALPALQAFDGLYLSGISLAILPKAARHRLIQTAATMKAAGKIVAFDSNYRPGLWESADDARATMNAMWSVTTLGLPSRDDEEALWGDANADRILDRLSQLGVPEIALKDGPAGPHLALLGEIVPRATYEEAASVVDTTSAGDSFNGGYLAARICGLTLAAAARCGHDLASVVIGHRGAIIPREAMPDPVVPSAQRG